MVKYLLFIKLTKIMRILKILAYIFYFINKICIQIACLTLFYLYCYYSKPIIIENKVGIIIEFIAQISVIVTCFKIGDIINKTIKEP